MTINGQSGKDHHNKAQMFSYYLFFLFLSISLNAAGQPASGIRLAEDQVRKEYSRYNKNGRSDSTYRRLKAALYVLQGKGFFLYYQRQAYDSASQIMTEVIPYWEKLADTSAEANLLKFRGLMKGYMHKFKSGKADLLQSVRLFTLKGFQSGVNVAKFDLATLYVLEGKLPTARSMSDSIKIYWKEKRDTSRVFFVNNLLIRILTVQSQLTEARKVQSENSILASSFDVEPYGLIDFYYLSTLLYSSLGDAHTAAVFRKKFNRLSFKERTEDGRLLKSTFQYK